MKKTRNGGRLPIVVVFAAHQHLAQLLGDQDQEHAGGETVKGVEAEQRLPRMLGVTMDEELGDDATARTRRRARRSRA